MKSVWVGEKGESWVVMPLVIVTVFTQGLRVRHLIILLTYTLMSNNKIAWSLLTGVVTSLSEMGFHTSFWKTVRIQSTSKRGTTVTERESQIITMNFSSTRPIEDG